MDDTFVPVDLDQLLDEFEENEGNTPSPYDSRLTDRVNSTINYQNEQKTNLNSNNVQFDQSTALNHDNGNPSLVPVSQLNAPGSWNEFFPKISSGTEDLSSLTPPSLKEYGFSTPSGTYSIPRTSDEFTSGDVQDLRHIGQNMDAMFTPVRTPDNDSGYGVDMRSSNAGSDRDSDAASDNSISAIIAAAEVLTQASGFYDASGFDDMSTSNVSAGDAFSGDASTGGSSAGDAASCFGNASNMHDHGNNSLAIDPRSHDIEHSNSNHGAGIVSIASHQSSDNVDDDVESKCMSAMKDLHVENIFSPQNNVIVPKLENSEIILDPEAGPPISATIDNIFTPEIKGSENQSKGPEMCMNSDGLHVVPGAPVNANSNVNFYYENSEASKSSKELIYKNDIADQICESELDLEEHSNLSLDMGNQYSETHSINGASTDSNVPNFRTNDSIPNRTLDHGTNNLAYNEAGTYNITQNDLINDGTHDHRTHDHGTYDHGTHDHGTHDHGIHDHGTHDQIDNETDDIKLDELVDDTESDHGTSDLYVSESVANVANMCHQLTTLSNEINDTIGTQNPENTSHNTRTQPGENLNQNSPGDRTIGLQQPGLPRPLSPIPERSAEGSAEDLIGHSTGSYDVEEGWEDNDVLGRVAPHWIPDKEAPLCMSCGAKFTMVKRRHHCRACGKVFCSSCCNLKFCLQYLDNRTARVCQICCNDLLKAEALALASGQATASQQHNKVRHSSFNPFKSHSQSIGLRGSSHHSLPPQAPTLAAASMPATSSMRSGTELSTSAPCSNNYPENHILQDSYDAVLAYADPASSDEDCAVQESSVDEQETRAPESGSYIGVSGPIAPLPPILRRLQGDYFQVIENPDPHDVSHQLIGLEETVVFLLNKNLIVKVKRVRLDCCIQKTCWCFTSEGMGAANQEEMVVLLECLPDEMLLPKDILSHFNTAFQYAKDGHTVSDLGYTIFGQAFLGSNDNAGFLYIKPTLQCVDKLVLPSTAFVFGILIQRQETPWAQLFPIRLMTRLGAEFRYYPCPIMSIRNRPSVYGEIGHTIMNLLADFKNFQYSIPRISGLNILLEDDKTTIRLPQDRYDEIIKVVNTTDEHVMVYGGNFSLDTDSHLVCMQEQQGYKTQAINIQNQPRKVTGASFVVFNGTLKSQNSNEAKVSIVEDGIMIQMTSEVCQQIRQSVKEMQDYQITTNGHTIIVEWATSSINSAKGVFSPIDGIPLEDVPCLRVKSTFDFTNSGIYNLCWTDLFFLKRQEDTSHRHRASRDVNNFTGELARACKEALQPVLHRLVVSQVLTIGLRVQLDAEDVGYQVGSKSKPLPDEFMTILDDKLMPVISTMSSKFRGGALTLEMIFKITDLF